MAAFSSSSLAFSDHNSMRNGHGLLKHTKERVSKQHLVEHKMFGSKRKGIQLGKTFRKKGKDVGSKRVAAPKMTKQHGISPSLAEFDRMMNSISKHSGFSKKSFSRKQFG